MSGFDHPEVSPRLLSAATIALTGAAGALDAVTFFAYNEVFASTMTGNLIMLGLDIGRGRWIQTAEALCAIGGYIVGLAAGTVLAGLVMRRLPWRNAVGVTLTAELVLLALLGVGYYGFESTGTNIVRAVLLVAGGATAMGMQAAALRYVGPAGTPTNFLTGTVTNWVSAMVELHRPRWDGASALRIVAVAVAAGLAAVVQARRPDLTYLLPVLLVGIGVLLMARVTVFNHGGLFSGPPQFRDLDAILDGADLETAPELFAASEGVSEPIAGADGRTVYGRVMAPHGVPHLAVVTAIDSDGRMVDRQLSDTRGRYRVRTNRPGVHTIVCTPLSDSDAARPRSFVVRLHREPVERDLVLGSPSGQHP